jgi:hypothetical protein
VIKYKTKMQDHQHDAIKHQPEHQVMEASSP